MAKEPVLSLSKERRWQDACALLAIVTLAPALALGPPANLWCLAAFGAGVFIMATIRAYQDGQREAKNEEVK